MKTQSPRTMKFRGFGCVCSEASAAPVEACYVTIKNRLGFLVPCHHLYQKGLSSNIPSGEV